MAHVLADMFSDSRRQRCPLAPGPEKPANREPNPMNTTILKLRRREDDYNATMDDLAGRWAAIETLIFGKDWPADDLDALVNVSTNLERKILSAPCRTDADFRGKAQFLVNWIAIAGEHVTEVHGHLIDLADQLRAFQARQVAAVEVAA